MSFPTLASTLPHIKAGTLRALAVTGTARTPLLPEVPTLREAGLKDCWRFRSVHHHAGGSGQVHRGRSDAFCASHQGAEDYGGLTGQVALFNSVCPGRTRVNATGLAATFNAEFSIRKLV